MEPPNPFKVSDTAKLVYLSKGRSYTREQSLTPTGRLKKGIQVQLRSRALGWDDYPIAFWNGRDITLEDAIRETEQKMRDNSKTQPYKGSELYEVFLNIKNPGKIDFEGRKFSKMGSKVRQAKQESKDGLMVLNVIDPGSYPLNVEPATSIAVFNPSQIKSATDNTGDYDGAQDSILASAPAAIRPGARLDEIKKIIPKDAAQPVLTDMSGSDEAVYQRIEAMLEQTPTVVDPWGNTILLANPERGSLATRARHLAGARMNPYGTAQRSFDENKARWMPNTASTVREAFLMASHNAENLYFRRYANGQLHMVVTDRNGGVTDQGIVYDGGLISQYTPEPQKQFRGAIVREVRTPTAAPVSRAGQTLAPQPGQPDEAGAIPAQTGQQNDNQRGMTGQSLLSAPAQDDKQAQVREILEDMYPIWRDVLQDKWAGMDIPAIAAKRNISETAVGNVLRMAEGRLRILLDRAATKPTVRVEDGVVKAAGGRPDLAMSGAAAFAGVDQRRMTPEEVTHAEMNELATRLFAVDPDAAENLVVRWMNSGTTVLSTDGFPDGIKAIVSEAQARNAAEMLMTAAAKMLVPQKAMQGGNSTQIARLIYLYRNTGTEQSRALGMRRDPFDTPAERAAMYIQETLLSPPESMRNKLRRNPANRGKGVSVQQVDKIAPCVENGAWHAASAFNPPGKDARHEPSLEADDSPQRARRAQRTDFLFSDLS